MKKTDEEKKSRTGRTKVSENNVSTPRRNFSQRAKDGVISIKNGVCPYCHHKKLWSKPAGLFCARCRRKLKR